MNTTPTTGHSSLYDPGQEPHKDKDKDWDFIFAEYSSAIPWACGVSTEEEDEEEETLFVNGIVTVGAV